MFRRRITPPLSRPTGMSDTVRVVDTSTGMILTSF